MQALVAGETTGFIRVIASLVDGSQLHVREYVNRRLKKVDYAYHHQTNAGKLIFRYDNTPHHPEVRTHPHHKHEAGLVKSIRRRPPDLADVLDEIARRLRQ